MRRSWPDASEASTFEGRVLTRSSVLVDFRLPVTDGAFRAGDESLVFVAPSTGAEVEYDVDVEAEGIGLAPIPPAPAPAPGAAGVVGAAPSAFPGSHWLTPPPELSQEVLARMMSRPDPTEADEDDLTLPVLPLARRRGTVEALLDAGVDAGQDLVGRTTTARVGRLGVVVSLAFAGLAVNALVDGHMSLATSPAPRDRVPALTAAAASKPEAVVRAPAPVVISGGAPVWVVVAPKMPRALPPLPTEPAPVEKLGLPRPPPAPPRTAVARL